MDVSNPLLLIGGIILIWFVARFGFGKRYGAPSFAGMFRREAPMVLHGLGPSALRTMLGDFKAMIALDNDLRGLILAGPFAASRATAHSPVTMILLAKEIAPYSGRNWFARWPYIQRGHLVLSHEERVLEQAIAHKMTLQGAPALSVVFLSANVQTPPEEIAEAIEQGAIVADTGTSDAKALLERWTSMKTSEKENG